MTGVVRYFFTGRPPANQQLVNGPMIWTGFGALDKLLGKKVYNSQDQIGGPRVMVPNGVTHQFVQSDQDNSEVMTALPEDASNDPAEEVVSVIDDERSPPVKFPDNVEVQPLLTLSVPQEVLGKGFEVVRLRVGAFEKPLNFLLSTTLPEEVVITPNACAMLGKKIARTVDLEEVAFEGGMRIGNLAECTVSGFVQAHIADKALKTTIDGMLGLGFLERYDIDLDRVRSDQHIKDAGAAAVAAPPSISRIGAIYAPGIALPGVIIGIPMHVTSGSKVLPLTEAAESAVLEGSLEAMLRRLTADPVEENATNSVRRVLQMGAVMTGHRLSDEEIRALPRVRFEEAERQHCSICLEAYQQGQLLTATRCGHFFHVECLAGWMQRATQCPLCRQECGAMQQAEDTEVSLGDLDEVEEEALSYNEVLKFGAQIVDTLVDYEHPVFVYILRGELRGGPWVVVDAAINPAQMEMYADVQSHGGILEAAGIVEVEFRTPQQKELMHRLDPELPLLNALLESSASAEVGVGTPAQDVEVRIKAREEKLAPLYTQVACEFADLHDRAGRMEAKGVIRNGPEWRRAREYSYMAKLKEVLADMG